MRFFTVSVDEAVDKALSSIGQNSRFLICGDPALENVYLTEEFEDGRPSVAETLSSLKQIRPKDLLEESKAYAKQFRGFSEGYTFQDFQGDWETAKRQRRVIRHGTQFSVNRPSCLGNVLMAEIEVENPWEMLAHFQYRIWYESWFLPDHCSMWRHWFETYDAHIVSITGSTLEARVLNPPTTKQQAIQLAWEHYYYCSDIVDVIAERAVSLLNSHCWSFWWD